MNVIHPPRIRLETFQRILDDYNSPLAPDAQQAYRIITDYDIDPAFALAMFAKESVFGTRGLSVKTRNFGNVRTPYDEHHIGIHPAGFVIYPTWLAGLLDWAQRIRYRYAEQWNLRTVQAIIPTYAPASDGNNPDHYITQVITWMHEWQEQEYNAMQYVDLRRVLPASPNSKNPPTHKKTSVTIHYNGLAVHPKPDQDGWTHHLSFIADYHQRHLGENAIAYHYAIDNAGRVYHLRDDNDHTWHCANYTGNTSSIAVHFPLGGNQDATTEQWTALLVLVDKLSQEHGFHSSALYSHREWPHSRGDVQPGRWVGHSQCPGAALTARLMEHRAGPHGTVLARFAPPRVYRVIDVIDYANIREGWSTEFPIADDGHAQLVPGAEFRVGALVRGQAIGKTDTWCWVVEAGDYREPGFIHASIVEAT